MTRSQKTLILLLVLLAGVSIWAVGRVSPVSEPPTIWAIESLSRRSPQVSVAVKATSAGAGGGRISDATSKTRSVPPCCGSIARGALR